MVTARHRTCCALAAPPPAPRAFSSPMTGGRALRPQRTASCWWRRSTVLRRPVPLPLPIRNCAPAPTLIDCFRAASVAPTRPNDWFLRSSFLGNGGNGNGGNGNGPPPGILPPDPAPDSGVPPPPGIWPIIGPEIATYGVVQPIARQMGLTTLGTLHERVGDAAADAACLNAPSTGAIVTKAPPVPESICRPAVWGRLFGQQIDNHYRAFADPRASGQVAGIQTGIDVWRGSLIPGHIDTAGVYFAYGNGNVRVDGLVTNAAATAYILQRTGSLNLNAYSFGGYWTHYGP